MKSIKPGRGPSMMGGIGSIVAIAAGVFWTIAAISMGAPGFFPAFGVLFIIVGIVQMVYHFKNATSPNRYSAFDITDDDEEPDPLNDRFAKCDTAAQDDSDGGQFCPYCGAKTGRDHMYCKKCGRKI